MEPRNLDEIRMRKKYSWMSDDQFECYQMLCDIYGGGHHVHGKVKASGSGIVINTRSHYAATYDSGMLTRAVIMAHDRCIRFEVTSSGPNMLKLFLHKRDRKGLMHERHPSLDEAVKSLRSNFPLQSSE